MLEIWKKALSLDRIELIPPPPGSANHHYKGYREGESQPYCFIKSTTKHAGYLQEIAGATYLSSLGYDQQRVLGHGERDGQYWIAHPWLDGTAFENPTVEDVAQAARVIGELHKRTMGTNAGNLRPFSLTGELGRQLAKLPKNDPKMYPEVAKRFEHLQAAGFDLDAMEREMPHCMLHGDFGWRNYHRLADGRLVLIDFEHAAYGPIWMEFSKSFSLELADPTVLEIFLSHYQQALGQTVSPPQPYILAAHLWQAAGTFNYCGARHHDEAFYQQGLNKLCLFDEMMNGTSPRRDSSHSLRKPVGK